MFAQRDHRLVACIDSDTEGDMKGSFEVGFHNLRHREAPEDSPTSLNDWEAIRIIDRSRMC